MQVHHSHRPGRDRFLPGLVFAAAIWSGGVAPADLFEDYTRRADLDFQFPLSADPGATTGGALLDHLPDGRRVILTTRLANPQDFSGAAELRVETAPLSGDFRYLGDVPLDAADPLWFNPGGLLAISGGGFQARVAVGNANGSVGVFSAADLQAPTTPPPAGTPAPVGVRWYRGFGDTFVGDAHWLDDRHLAIASGQFGGPSQVNLLDTDSATALPVAPVLVNDIRGSTGGLVFDGQGNLYVGLGFGDQVGTIHRFEASAWMGGAVNFSDGTLLAQLLSAADLTFDPEGNLIAGGGDLFGTSGAFNYFAVHDLSGAMRADRRFDPDVGTDQNFYSVDFDDSQSVIYAWDNFGSSPRQVFAVGPRPIPETACGWLGAVGLLAGGLCRPQKGREPRNARKQGLRV